MAKKKPLLDIFLEAGMKKLSGKTSNERIKEARQKIANLKRIREAELLEDEAKEAEIDYKKTHPKRWGLF